MKFRNGFVSNSSSSSFIIAFEHKPTSATELHALMFPNGPTEVSMYENEAFTSEEIAMHVFDDLQRTEDISLADVINEISHGVDGYEDIVWPAYPGWDADEIAQTKYRKACASLAIRIVSQMTNGHTNFKFYSLEYSDNDGMFQSTIEHGNVFNALKACRVSHH